MTSLRVVMLAVAAAASLLLSACVEFSAFETDLDDDECDHNARNLERLAAEYAAGHAVVDPERDACRYCHLPMLCRIDELGGVTEADEEGDDA